MLLPIEYDMVFWADGERDATALTIDINNFLSKYGTDYMPLYLAANKVILEPDPLRQAYVAWTSKEGTVLAVVLKSNNELVLRITIHKKKHPNVHFPETLRIGFNLEHVTGKQPLLTLAQLQEIFLFCLELFKPYYAYCSKSGEVNYSATYERIRQVIDHRKIPAAIKWFNYFEPVMVERLGGVEKLLSAPVYLAQTVERLGGVIFILQEEPFDFRNPIHLQRPERVEAYLDLNRLHKLYPG